MYCLCVNVYYFHRVTTQLQLTNISYHINARGKQYKLSYSCSFLWSLLIEQGQLIVLQGN
jgi:hypothetical protein